MKDASRTSRDSRTGLAMKGIAGVIGAAVGLVATPAVAYEARETFRKGAIVLSVEGGYGAEDSFADVGRDTGLEFVNAGARISLVSLGPTGSGILYGALEVGLEPFYQRYTDPVDAFFAGLGTVVRYHFLSLGRFVPYVELFGAAGGTDLEVHEIDSDFTFLVQGGVGASVFVTDRMAIYAGYRLQHVSNGGTDRPNRGFESHTGVVGMSFFLP